MKPRTYGEEITPPPFEEVWHKLPAAGWLSKDEAQLLWELGQKTKGDILEVGCYKGRSTILLALLGRKVHAVDFFAGFDSNDPAGDGVYQELLDNLWRAQVFNVEIHRQRIQKWKPRPCELCYLDGDHTMNGTKDQINKALECNPKIVAIHDVNDDGAGIIIKQAAMEMLGVWEKRIDRLAYWDMEKRKINEQTCHTPDGR